MKKISYIIGCCVILMMFSGCTSLQSIENNEGIITYNYEDVKEILIRFHVIANSDSEEDQNLKLKVRDEVIKYLYPYLKNSTSIDESREILKNKDEEVLKIAQKVIKENGYSYSVRSELSKENFPDKVYGNILLPQGEYEAYRILIGEEQGQNWWCVMFPPLCFIDVTKGEVEEEKTKEMMDLEVQKNGLSEEDQIELKFKSLEFLEDIFN